MHHIEDIFRSARTTVANVEVYSSFWCPYCYRAKNLLKSKGVEFKEIEVDNDANLRAEMVQRAGGRRTVPQIFIDGKHVGGSDELAALDRDGTLDALLGIGA
jgi:glutaredoxin 3